MRCPGSERRTSASVAAILLLCGAACTGCYSFKPVTVHVLDAETGAPVERARVCISHHRQDFTQLSAPGGKCVPAVKGKARVGAELHYGPLVRVTAEGYIPGGAAIHETYPKTGRGLEERVRLYREPHPAVVITLPAGYRGIVKVALRSPEFRDGNAIPSATYPAGQRLFSFPLKSPASINWFEWSPLIPMAMPRHCYAIYDDGSPLITARWENHNSVALRPIGFGTSIGNASRLYLFYVGTAAEYAPVAQQVNRAGHRMGLEWAERVGTPSGEATDQELHE